MVMTLLYTLACYISLGLIRCKPFELVALYRTASSLVLLPLRNVFRREVSHTFISYLFAIDSTVSVIGSSFFENIKMSSTYITAIN